MKRNALRTCFSLAVVVSLASLARAEEIKEKLPQPPEGRVWKLVWSDEFEGDKLDKSKWDVPDNRRRDGWWSPKAVSLTTRTASTSPDCSGRMVTAIAPDQDND